MLHIGLIKEGKVPADNRVALTPQQCRWLCDNIEYVTISVQPAPHRCFSDAEYKQQRINLSDDLTNCDVLLGIKEVPVTALIENKTYLFFSHTKKAQSYNQKLMHAMADKNITLIDYECMEHDDGQRIIGFGFFAGIVGAHNGIMAYGNRTGNFKLGRVYKSKDYRDLIQSYFGLKLPNIKVAVTGSGRVAHGILEVMNLMDVQEVEPEEYTERSYPYPVYVHLKGSDLYRNKETKKYSREEFHLYPQLYECLFQQYAGCTDILMNGVYWEQGIPRLFELEDMRKNNFRIQTIADITDDVLGSIPCNIGDATLEQPVYGIDKFTGERILPYQQNSVDIMAVGNLPNELPRDASNYFGEQLMKYILPDLLQGGSNILQRATILKNGTLAETFNYLQEYARH